MKTIFAAATALALAVSAAPAMAQDGQKMGTFAIGAIAGLDHVTLDDGTDEGSKDGVVFGITANYDLNIGMALLGVEGELTDSSVSESATGVFEAGDAFKLSAGRDIYVGLRAGIRPNDKLAVFVKGGYTNAKVKGTYTDGTGVAYGDSLTLDGYRIGGGVEYAVSAPIALRAEYRYSDYETAMYAGINTGINSRRHQVTASLIARY